jgi:trk system potassium uptake protein TrkA
MYIVVVGAGKVGQQLVRTLLQQGHHVAVLEKRADVCARLAEETSARVVCGDGTDVSALDQAGADRADVLAAVSGFDEENLVVCLLAKEFFNVPRTVARVNSPRNERIFESLGIDRAVSVTTVIAHLIEETATLSDVLTLHYLERGKVEIVEIVLPPTSPVLGLRLSEVSVRLPEGVVFVSILRNGHVIIPRGDTVFEGGDAVLAVTEVGREPLLRKVLVEG